MGLGPHPPGRPPHRDDAFASARPCLLIPSQELALARVTERCGTSFRWPSAELSRTRGWTAFAFHRLPSVLRAAHSRASSWSTLAAGSFAPTRSARTPPVAQSPRCRSENRHRCRRAWPKPRCPRSDSAARALPVANESRRGGLAIPPIGLLARAALMPTTTRRSGGIDGDRSRRHARRFRALHGLARHGWRHRPLTRPAAWG